MDVTPGWKFVAIGAATTPVAIRRIDVWKHESAWVRSGDNIVVAHPSYPLQRHTLFVYRLEVSQQTADCFEPDRGGETPGYPKACPL